MSEALISQLQKDKDDLKSENHKYRSRLREFKKQVEEQESELGKLRAQIKPKDGTVILEGDDAKRWDAFKALNKTPEQITAALEEGEKAKGKLAELDWSASARKAAEAAGFEADAFLAFPGVKDLSFEVKRETVDGKETDRAYVKAGNETKPLDMTFVETREDWKALKGALGKAETQPTPTGQRWTTERVEGRKSGKATEEDIRKATEATVNYQI